MKLKKILTQLVDGAKEILEADGAAVYLLDEGAAHLSVVAVSGVSMLDTEQEPLPVEGCPIDQEALARKYVILINASSDPRAANLPKGYRSLICAPLFSGKSPLGTLHIYAVEAGRFREKEAQKLVPLAAIGAEALVTAREMDALENLKESRDKFIRITSHELRSPVTVAQSLIRGVLKGYAGKLNEKQQDIFGRVNRQLDYLENLVTDLLALAEGQISDMAKKKEMVRVSVSVGRAALLIQPRAEEKNVKLAYRTDPKGLIAWGTEEGMDRIFVNLIENAVKYTPSGGTVVVSAQEEGKEIQVEVSDTGIGIPEEAIPQIFDEFYRAPNAKMGKEIGTGLGLSIVKDLLEGFEGKIKVKSQVGEGSAFTVIFPNAGDK